MIKRILLKITLSVGDQNLLLNNESSWLFVLSTGSFNNTEVL